MTKRRVALRVLGRRQDDDLEPEELDQIFLFHDVNGYVRRPRLRSDCSPSPATVACPLPACGAGIDEFCLQFDPQEEVPEADRTYPPLLDRNGNRVPGPPHFARIELARAHLRPCPWVGCKHHLFLDVDPNNGTIIYNFPGKEVEDLKYTCAEDLAQYGGLTLEMIGEVITLTRERIRQLETRALEGLREVAASTMEPDERRLEAERVASQTKFDAEPARRLVKVGICRDCRSQRVKVKGLWRCRCKRSWGASALDPVERSYRVRAARKSPVDRDTEKPTGLGRKGT